MDRATLDRVAREGIQGAAEQLSDLAAFCQDWGRETGDARFLLLAELFRSIDAWWGEQGVGLPLLRTIDHEIRDLLPEILAQTSAADGSRLAAVLAERVEPHLVPTQVWARANRQED